MHNISILGGTAKMKWTPTEIMLNLWSSLKLIRLYFMWKSISINSNHIPSKWANIILSQVYLCGTIIDLTSITLAEIKIAIVTKEKHNFIIQATFFGYHPRWPEVAIWINRQQKDHVIAKPHNIYVVSDMIMLFRGLTCFSFIKPYV